MRQRLTVIVAAILLTASPATASAQRGARLEALTAPRQALPPGCRLEPTIGVDGRQSFVAYPGVRENPWIGADIKAALVRGVVDGPALESDETGSERVARLSIGLRAAYRAVYLAADGSRIHVYAAEFDAPGWTLRAAATRLIDIPRRVITLGSTAVVVLPGKGGDCFRAVGDYIASLR